MADTTIWWRRICLEKQLPTIRFLAGVRAPAVLCCLCLVVVCGLAVLEFRGTPGRSVPRGVLISQGQVTERLARGLRGVITRAQDDLVAAGASYAGNPTRAGAPAAARDSLLASIDTDTAPWAGVGVVAAGSHEVLAHRGRPLPVGQLPAMVAATTVVPAVVADRDPVVLLAVVLADHQLLVASVPLSMRPLYLNAAAGQSVFVGKPDGEFATGQGPARSGADPATRRLITRTIIAAVRAGTRVSRAAGPPPGGQPAAHQPATGLLVTAAPVGDLGIAVVSAVRVALVPATTNRWRGLPVALGLLGVTVVVLLLLETALIRPVNRLLTRATAIASGDVRVRAGRIRCREARRVDLALDTIVARLAADPRRPGRGPGRGPGPGPGREHGPGPGPARGQWYGPGDRGGGLRRATAGRVRVSMVVLLASGLIVGWAGVVGYRYAFTPTRLPDQITYDTGTTTDGVALAIRECFTGGLARLTAEAHRPDVGQPAAAQLAVLGLVRDGRTFRSAYLVDARGDLTARGGRDPSRSGSGRPQVGGVFLDRPGGRAPVLYAAVPFPGDRVLVAEFDVGHLRALMPRAGGRLRLVDARMRVLLDTEGFIAFSDLPDATLRQAAARAGRGERVATVTRVGGVGTLVAAAAVSRVGSPAPPGLALVSQRPTSTFQLPDNEPRHAAWLVSFLALGVAVLLRAWYGLTVLGPLRAVAAAADRLAAGDERSVVTAMRHDEIGAIAICLDLCRQVLVDGPARFGGTTRYAPTTRED